MKRKSNSKDKETINDKLLKEHIEDAIELLESTDNSKSFPVVQVFSGDNHQVTTVQHPKKQTSIVNNNIRNLKNQIKAKDEQIEDLHTCRERMIKTHDEYRFLAELEIKELTEMTNKLNGIIKDLQNEIDEIKGKQ